MADQVPFNLDNGSLRTFTSSSMPHAQITCAPGADKRFGTLQIWCHGGKGQQPPIGIIFAGILFLCICIYKDLFFIQIHFCCTYVFYKCMSTYFIYNFDIRYYIKINIWKNNTLYIKTIYLFKNTNFHLKYIYIYILF